MSKFKRRQPKQPEPSWSEKRKQAAAAGCKTGGANPTHGGFAEVRKFRRNELDSRTKNARAIMEFQKGVAKDCGGIQELDTFQASLIDRACECLIILRCMAAYVEKEGIMGKDGQLTACLRDGYIAYANSFRHTMESIYSRIGKKYLKPLDLGEYLTENYGQERES